MGEFPSDFLNLSCSQGNEEPCPRLSMSIEASSLDSLRNVLATPCLHPTLGQQEIDFLNKHGILQKLERERVRVSAPAIFDQLTFAN